MKAVSITAAVMNPGTDKEFVRLFATCPDGHDLGSAPVLDALRDGHPWDIRPCAHYAHKKPVPRWLEG